MEHVTAINDVRTMFWRGQPCPSCQRVMNVDNPPHVYVPPTAAPYIYRILCRICIAGLGWQEPLV